MGFSTAATHLIFFIAVVGMSAGLIAVFSGYVDSASGAMSDKQHRITDQLRTDVKIVNAYYDDSTNPDTLYVYAKNVGTKVLGTDCVDLYIDNGYVDLIEEDIRFPDNLSTAQYWGLEESLRFNATQDLTSAVHEARIITCNGVTDTFDFST